MLRPLHCLLQSHTLFANAFCSEGSLCSCACDSGMPLPARPGEKTFLSSDCRRSFSRSARLAASFTPTMLASTSAGAPSARSASMIARLRDTGCGSLLLLDILRKRPMRFLATACREAGNVPCRRGRETGRKDPSSNSSRLNVSWSVFHCDSFPCRAIYAAKWNVRLQHSGANCAWCLGLTNFKCEMATLVTR